MSLKNNLQIVVSREDKTKFWLDDWCGNGILRDLFLGLFSICTNINNMIELWSPERWNLVFITLLNEREIDGVVELLSLIGGFPGTTLEPHTLAWENHKDGIFFCEQTIQAWLVARKDVLTHEVMQKRRINIVSRCLHCKEALETNKHLFMHCKVTHRSGIGYIYKHSQRTLDCARTYF